jgi:hypothetical protein
MLIEGVSSGVGSAHVQAEILGKRFPEALVQALIQGARVSTKAWTTRHFISLLATNDSAEAKAFMKNALHDGSALCRATAALTLVHNDRAGTIAGMIQEWKRYTNSISPFDFESSLPIAHFLASMDSSEAITALKHNLQLRPALFRVAVVNEVAGGTSNDHFCLINDMRERPPVESARVEEFLIAALQDEGQHEKISGHCPLDGRFYSNLRVCDKVGHMLKELWRDRYHFDLCASQNIRDIQIAAIEDAWKQAHPEK